MVDLVAVFNHATAPENHRDMRCFGGGLRTPLLIPDRYIRVRVRAVLKGETAPIECGKEMIVRGRLKTDYLKALPRHS